MLPEEAPMKAFNPKDESMEPVDSDSSYSKANTLEELVKTANDSEKKANYRVKLRGKIVGSAQTVQK